MYMKFVGRAAGLSQYMFIRYAPLVFYTISEMDSPELIAEYEVLNESCASLTTCEEQSETAEYEALNQSYASLIKCVRQSPNAIADELKSSGKLAPEVLSFLSNQTHDDGEKARKLIDAILDQVQNEPQVFDTFVSAMKAAGSWTKAAVCKLESKYKSLKSARAQAAEYFTVEHHPCETSSLKSSRGRAQAQVLRVCSSPAGSQLPQQQLHSGE